MSSKRASSRAKQIVKPRRLRRAPGAGLPAPSAGLPPGTPLYIGAREPTKATMSLYRYDEATWSLECPISVEALLELAHGGGVGWINVNGLSGGIVEKLCEGLGVHPLVVEDILNTEHRPKAESYGDYLFMVAKMLTTREDGSIEYEQVSLVRKGNLVLTIQETPGDCLGPVRQRIEGGIGSIRKRGADYLFYALLDVIVDNYFTVVGGVADRLEDFELEAGNPKARRDFAEGLQAVRAELLHLRRTLWPARDAISALARLDGGHFSEGLSPFLRDLQENVVQAIEAVESCREQAASLLELHLSAVNTRMGEVMKVLTIMSTIFIPLTFIAGVYGMNFRFMPELEQAWGYPAILGVMALVAALELLVMKVKHWI